MARRPQELKVGGASGGAGTAGADWLEATRPGYQTLVVGRRGPVGWLVFNRPGSGNAMDATMLDELEQAWADLDGDDEVRVVVNTGAGTAFQTGLDMVQLSRDPKALAAQARRTRSAELRLTAWQMGVWKPVIAAVNGVCAGGGLHFVADADIVIASAAATFLDPHVSVGQVSAYETIALARQSPMGAILRMALVGRYERVDAARAHQLGIVSEVVADDDWPEAPTATALPPLRARAQALAETVARRPAGLLAATKRALWGALEVGRADARPAAVFQVSEVEGS